MTSTQRLLPFAALLGLCALLFFWKLGDVPLIGLDEALYAECSREMAASGNYLVPTYNGEYFFDKPPLVYWLQAVSMHVLGPTALAARLQSAVSALLLTAFVVMLGSRVYGRGGGLLAGFILASSILATGLARLCLLDQLFVLTLTVSLGSFILTHRGIWRRRGYLLFWASAALSVMVKGPAGLVLIIAVLGAYVLITRQWRAPLSAMPGWGLLIMVAIILPWYVMVERESGGTFLKEFILHQNVQRAMGKDFHHNQPLWFYIPIFIAGFFPWSIYIPSALRGLVRFRPKNDREHLSLFAAVWLLVVVTVFSVLRSKLPSYIYPAFPAAALLVGALWAQAMESKQQVKTLIRPTAVAVAVGVLLGAAMLAGQALLPRPIPGLSNALIPMGASLLIGNVMAICMLLRGRSEIAFGSLCGGASAFLLVAVTVGLPIAAKSLAEPARDLGVELRTCAAKQDRVVVFNPGMKLPTLPFYAQRRVDFIYEKPQLRQLLASGEQYLVVTPKDQAGDLPSRGVLLSSEGKFGIYRYRTR